MIPVLLRFRLIAAFVAGLAVAATSGCLAVAAGAAGAGAVAWVRGELEAQLPNDFERVDRAANRAILELGFAKVNEGKSAVDAEIIARTGQDKRIQIRLDRTADQLTRVRIRVGIVGDEVLSRTILDKIKENL